MKRVLKLNKEVVASLNIDAMDKINGGDIPTETAYTYCPVWTCPSCVCPTTQLNKCGR